MSGRDEPPLPAPEQAPAQPGDQTRRSLLRKLAYSTPAIVALSVGARQAEAQAPPGFKPPAPPHFGPTPLNSS